MNAFATLPTTAFSAALFDVAQFCVLGELEDEGDAEIIAEVVSQFLEDADVTLDDLHHAIDEEDFGGTMMKAHTLKGSFATFGLMRAHALAREMEHLAEERESVRMPGLFREMMGCFVAGKRALESHMGVGRRWLAA